jgi:hypothetical protein
MMAVPATRLIDFQEVRLTLGLTHARLATEDVVHMRTAEYRTLVHPAVVSLARVEAARHGW